jgi:regulator of protease activity HflC (stomatin/prohibitin superfamily)
VIAFVARAWRAVFRRGREPAKPARGTGSRPAAEDDAAATIAEAIAEAKREAGLAEAPEARRRPAGRKTPPPMTPERQRLIEDAIAIHRSKTHVFDGLSPEAKEKLMVMALHTLAPEVLDRKLGRPKRGGKG